MLKIMIVEDEPFIADMAEEILTEQGFEVCGIARTVKEAILLARLYHPDVAVIDMRLADGGIGTEIVSKMGQEANFGVVYATGDMLQAFLTRSHGAVCLSKPYLPEDLVRGVQIAAQLFAQTPVFSPFPAAIRILGDVHPSSVAETK